MTSERQFCPKCGSPLIERYTDRSGPDRWHCHGCNGWFDKPSAYPDEQGTEDIDAWEGLSPADDGYDKPSGEWRCPDCGSSDVTEVAENRLLCLSCGYHFEGR